MEIVRGDLKCNRCGDDYFSKNATKDMEKHNLCWHCVAEHNKRGTSTLESFAEGIRKISHYKI